jgi:D-3-phosphoglycerate dehydrogenase
MAKVLVTDSLAEQGLAILEQSPGLDVEARPGLAPEELLEAIRDAEALVIRSGTKVTADVIAAGEKLRVIGRAGIGIDNVDVAAATARGIVVMNTPEGNNVTTAEHAIALLISLARHIPQATASMKEGRWEKKGFVGMELYNRTLGVVGLGNIGRIVAVRGRGLGMKVVASDPFITDAAARMLDVELVPFEELLARADVISVHVPRTKDTAGLIGREALTKVKPGLLLINAARGGIVDEEALLEALDDGRVAGAALDVFEQEPTPPDHPLVLHDKVICTPHLGASTEQAQVNVSIAVAEQVRDYLIPGAAVRGLDRADRNRILGRSRGARRDAADDRRAEGPARVGVGPGQHGERAAHRPVTRHQGHRVEVEPHPRLRQRHLDPRHRVRRAPDRGRHLPRWAAAHRTRRRLHARGHSRGPDPASAQPRRARRGGVGGYGAR